MQWFWISAGGVQVRGSKTSQQRRREGRGEVGWFSSLWRRRCLLWCDRSLSHSPVRRPPLCGDSGGRWRRPSCTQQILFYVPSRSEIDAPKRHLGAVPSWRASPALRNFCVFIKNNFDPNMRTLAFQQDYGQ